MSAPELPGEFWIWPMAIQFTENRSSIFNTLVRKVGECEWVEWSDFDNSGTYETCKDPWVFIDGGVSENNVKHCPYCGDKIKIVELRGS